MKKPARQSGRPVRNDTDDAAAGYASPPCFLHELDPSYLGYMGREELLALLNLLLECERAGARGVGRMGRDAAAAHRPLLAEVARDEARYCAMLTRHIARLGGEPSGKTGSFFGKLVGTDGLAARLSLLDRGQGWVVRKIRESLPRIDDDLLRADLVDMVDVHERNIARCNAIAPAPAGPTA